MISISAAFLGLSLAAAAAQQVAQPTPTPAAPAQTAPQAPAAVPADVCLTNACAEALKVAASPAVATCAPTPCRVEHIGRALIPSGQAFNMYFDGNSPVLIKGRVVDVMLRDDGISSEFVVEHNENGKLTRWRIVGGSAATMPANVRAVWEQSIGAEVVVRGYQTHDKGCEGGCIANGRDVTRPDGSRFGDAPKPGP